MPSERAFSHAGRADSDPCWRNLGAEKFRTMQRLKEAYQDGRMTAQNKAWMEIGPSFYDADWDMKCS